MSPTPRRGPYRFPPGLYEELQEICSLIGVNLNEAVVWGVREFIRRHRKLADERREQSQQQQ